MERFAARGRSVARCLRTVLTEEHEHHRFCVRDLDLAGTDGVGAPREG